MSGSMYVCKLCICMSLYVCVHVNLIIFYLIIYFFNSSTIITIIIIMLLIVVLLNSINIINY